MKGSRALVRIGKIISLLAKSDQHFVSCGYDVTCT
jgi:hypothetical protein